MHNNSNSNPCSTSLRTKSGQAYETQWHLRDSNPKCSHNMLTTRSGRRRHNKKVLLRDCKRCTARCVASAHSRVLSWGWGVPQSQLRVPYLLAGTGVPPWLRVPPKKDQRPGTAPQKGPGTRDLEKNLDWSTPSLPPRKDLGKNLGLGYPSPGGRTNKVRTLLSFVLQMRAVTIVSVCACINTKVKCILRFVDFIVCIGICS